MEVYVNPLLVLLQPTFMESSLPLVDRGKCCPCRKLSLWDGQGESVDLFMGWNPLYVFIQVGPFAIGEGVTWGPAIDWSCCFLPLPESKLLNYNTIPDFFSLYTFDWIEVSTNSPSISFCLYLCSVSGRNVAVFSYVSPVKGELQLFQKSSIGNILW